MSRIRIWLLLIVIAIMTGCSSTGAYRMSYKSANYDVWTFKTNKSTGEVLSTFNSVAESPEFGLIVSYGENSAKTETYLYEGKHEGFWIFGSHWQEIIWFGVQISSINKSYIKVTLYAQAMERPNENWEWQPVKSFDRATPLFRKFSHSIKMSLGV